MTRLSFCFLQLLFYGGGCFSKKPKLTKNYKACGRGTNPNWQLHAWASHITNVRAIPDQGPLACAFFHSQLSSACFYVFLFLRVRMSPRRKARRRIHLERKKIQTPPRQTLFFNVNKCFFAFEKNGWMRFFWNWKMNFFEIKKWFFSKNENPRKKVSLRAKKKWPYVFSCKEKHHPRFSKIVNSKTVNEVA